MGGGKDKHAQYPPGGQHPPGGQFPPGAHGMMAGVAVAGAAAYGAHHMGHGGGHYPAPGTTHYGHNDHGKHDKGHGKFKQGKGKGKYKQGKFGKNHGGKFKKWK
ncbi:glycine-rich protein A3-like [Solanum tuberosum]|nr:PREDICTED: glycine-rich protein A3-like [Solanum tuberosum]